MLLRGACRADQCRQPVRGTGPRRDRRAARHPRRHDVSGAARRARPGERGAADRAAAAGAGSTTVRVADASMVGAYADALPADVLLLCGIFGNVSDEDIRQTATAAAAMCAPGGTVIWTRHRRPPDLTGQIRNWFTAAGFHEVAFDRPATAKMTGVGVHRALAAIPDHLPDGGPDAVSGAAAGQPPLHVPVRALAGRQPPGRGPSLEIQRFAVLRRPSGCQPY